MIGSIDSIDNNNTYFSYTLFLQYFQVAQVNIFVIPINPIPSCVPSGSAISWK